MAIINESFARRHFPDEDPLGKQVDIGDGYNKLREIVGFVADAKGRNLTAPPPPEMYVVYLQRPWQWIRYAVRTGVAPDTLIGGIRHAVWSVDKDIPVTDIRTMDELIAQTVTEPRFYLILLGIFAGVALVLAAVGIYGVMSFTSQQRTQEIGIRMALGAQTADVLKLVIGQGMLLILAGIAIGLVAAFALTPLMKDLLFGLTATDPATFVGVVLILAGVALVACYLPARKATKVDPMVALKYE